MHTLPLSFGLLTLAGYWRPVKWRLDSPKYFLYNGYSVFMILLLYTFAFCGLVDSILSVDMKSMIDKFSLFVSVLGVCLKVLNLFVRRERIIGIVDTLLQDDCLPRDEEERIIRRKFDRHARTLTIYCEILNESAVFFATVAQFKRFLRTRTLPLADWVPYDLSSKNVFVMSLIHQTVALMICANSSVAHETLISGLMIQICAQFEILSHRARNLPILLMEARKQGKSEEEFKEKQRKIVGSLVEHHVGIFKFATSVNEVFTAMILVQFMVSSTVLCLSVYKMSTTNIFTVDFAWSLSYLGCMLVQVYLYCWYGNDVTLKSVQIGDAVYQMDWTLLPVNVTKDLLIIMARSRRPLKMSSGHIVTLSAESFMTIMKVSYSSYNLLKDSSSK